MAEEMAHKLGEAGHVHESVERWGMLEIVLAGPSQGNPYRDVRLSAQFVHRGRSVEAAGFYDGEGRYVIRFMPDTEGEWRYVTSSSSPSLDGIRGTFACTGADAAQGNHGPVRVRNEWQFAYEDGTPYAPFGTTCYAWVHQEERLQQETVRTLAQSPFNKLRMCVFPKNYSFNAAEPDAYPFAGSKEIGFDFERFNPHFWANLERRILDLQQLGIEADLILFHPYDKGRWGFDEMSAETDEFYLRYAIARLSAYRNVWWALANEYDLMEAKSMADWDRLFRCVQTEDPYDHPRSIHNWTRMYDPDSVVLYDHAKPWVTHCCIQYWDVTPVPYWHKRFRKPIVVDECCYEGNIPQRWGNISAQEMTHRFWDGVSRGGYVGHGETYVHPEDELWWAKGGKLYGDSPERIAFLRRVMEEAPAECRPVESIRDVPTIGVEGEYYLSYYGMHRPLYRQLELPEDGVYRAEVLDTWEMTVTTAAEQLSGRCRLELPGKPYLAVRIVRVG